MAPDGSSLLTLDASSVQTAPDGSRRIQKDRLDDHRDDQSASDTTSDAKASRPSRGWLGGRAGPGVGAPRSGLAVVLLVPDQIRGNLLIGTGDRWLDDPTGLERTAR